MPKKNHRVALMCVFGVAVVAWLPTATFGIDVTIYPSADGSLADGGLYGAFDGVADTWDWYFNESGYEGTITLTTGGPGNPLEHRVVWEYDLSGVSITPPVLGTLTFTLRGAPIFPFPDVAVHVVSYPADLVESTTDYSAGPTQLQGFVTISPYQDPTVFVLNVSDVVNEALQSGADMVAFRFQFDADTPNPANQAFIDALESDVTTKPFLTISDAVLGDSDGDGYVGLADYSAMAGCLSGPNVPPTGDCAAFDMDFDLDVDMDDFTEFQSAFTGSP